MYIESFDKLTDLVFHKGVIVDKRITVEYRTKETEYSHEKELDSTLTFRFMADNSPDVFTVSWLPKKMDNLLERGDSIEFYTKPVTSGFGNEASSGTGYITNTNSDREVFCLISRKYESPLIDFDEYNRSLRTGAYGCFALSLLCVFFYFVSRYGNGFGTSESVTISW